MFNNGEDVFYFVLLIGLVPTIIGSFCLGLIDKEVRPRKTGSIIAIILAILFAFQDSKK